MGAAGLQLVQLLAPRLRIPLAAKKKRAGPHLAGPRAPLRPHLSPFEPNSASLCSCRRSLSLLTPAAGTGALDATLAAKMAVKYDPVLEAEARAFIASITSVQVRRSYQKLDFRWM